MQEFFLNRNNNRAPRPAVSFVAFGFAATLLAGCSGGIGGGGGNDKFATVNGQVITKDEYIRALERQTVPLGPGQSITAERLVLDKLVGSKITLAEASKNNVLPKDEEVNKTFNVQKKLFEQQQPGKNFEQTLMEQGSSPEDLKNDIKAQMAETALFAKKINLDENVVNQAYEKTKGQLGLPARAQLRLLVVQTNSPDFQKATQLLKQKKSLADVASQLNPPQLRANGGLLQQAQPIANLGPWSSPVQKGAEGSYFGPVDFPGQKGVKAWVQIEKRYPAFQILREDALPLLRQQVVQQAILQPANATVRNEIMKQKMDAKFESSDKKYDAVWQAVKKAAQDAGVGQPLGATPSGGMPGGATLPGPGAGAGAMKPPTR